MNEQQVINKICSIAKNTYGWTEQQCLDSYKDPEYKTALALATQFKYAAVQSVPETPCAFINGVQADFFPESVAEWKSLLKKQLAATNPEDARIFLADEIVG